MLKYRRTFMNRRLVITLIVFCALMSSTALGSLGGSQSAVDTSLPALGSNALASGTASSTAMGTSASTLAYSQDLAAGEYDTSSVARIAESAPPTSQQQVLNAYNLNAEQPSAVYYGGRSISWNTFSSSYLGSAPGFWLDTAGGWSWYAMLPLGGWMRELMYIPSSGPLRVYEIYPSGMTATYNLGTARSGFNYVWFNGDTTGRHISIFTVNGVASNAVIVDVVTSQYYPVENPTYVPIYTYPYNTYPSSYYYGYGFSSEVSTGSGSTGTSIPSGTTPGSTGGQTSQGTGSTSSNKAPYIVSFGPEVPTPVGLGENRVRFITDARDPDGATIYFRYLLNGPSTGGAWQDQSSWIPDKYWLLTKTRYDKGTYQIQVQVRDKNHAGENAYDDAKITSYTIS